MTKHERTQGSPKLLGLIAAGALLADELARARPGATHYPGCNKEHQSCNAIERWMRAVKESLP